MKKFRPRPVRAALLASAALISIDPARAQEAPPADDKAAEAPAPNEIIVTARRRAERLQDVPIAISAFNAEALSNRQVDTLAGIQNATPNLYLNQGDAGNAVIYIRGVGQNDSLAFADPGVGVYIDDVYIARSQAAFLEVFDVDRIEVLRGPQGTFYGRNTIGGAVKFVSTRPTTSFSGYLEAGAGNFNSALVKARVSGPIAGEKLRGKIAFAYNRRDGYNNNSFTGRDDGDINSFSVRASLLYQPTPSLEFNFSADARFERPNSSRSPRRETPIAVFNGRNVVALPATSGPYDVQTNANGLSDQTGYGFALTGRWSISDRVTLESISAYRRFNFDLNLDTDASPFPVLDILLRQRQEQFSQELRVNYADSKLNFTGGLYYFYDLDGTFSGVDNGAATIFGFPVTAFGFPTSSLADTRQRTDSYAVFGDASYKLTERLSVSAGIRYTYEEKRSRRLFENFFNPAVSVILREPPFLGGVGIAGPPISGEASFDAFTPRVSISYKLAEPVLLYASASRGFKSGGFDGRATTNFGFAPFRPEIVRSYEGGAKTSWLNGKLIVNAAVFYNDYTDVQVTSFGSDPVTGTFVSLFTNAARESAVGGELEIRARPVEGLTIDGSLGVLKARYDAFNILVGGVVTDVTNRRVVNAPDFNGGLGVTWRLPVGSRYATTFHIDGAYRSTAAIEITDSPVLRQRGYEAVNLFVAFGDAKDRWQVRAGIQNVTDRAVRVQGFNLSEFPGVEAGFFAAPRTFDVRFIGRF